LLQLAEDPGLRKQVIVESMRVLRQDQWRGCEQACVLLARLDHKDSGRRMVELLGHERGEVTVAAAWGLTQLRVEALLPDMLDHAQSVFDGFRAGQLNDDMPGASLHVAHLFIALGDRKYGPADPLLRQYLPKDFSLGAESRAAAAWAVGFLYEEDPQQDLVALLAGRLNDIGGLEPELDVVRQMCAVSLGRMNVESSRDDLRKYAGSGGGVPGACSWALERITGEKPPPIEPQVRPVDDWFLAPLGDQGGSGVAK
jgi:HEAT repeat protein